MGNGIDGDIVPSWDETMNWSEFFAMKGYGLYVWGSYGMALLVFIIEIAMVRHRRTLIVQRLRQMRDAASNV